MKMELDHEKQNVSLGEIMYEYEYVNENDYTLPRKLLLPTAHFPLITARLAGLQAGTDSNVRAEVCEP
jgi:hypothetical protein